MLYERWVQIGRERKHLTALRDLAVGKEWTFAELHQATEAGLDESGVGYPAGQGAGFVLEVLRAWRSGVVVCPLEAGQEAPFLKDLPAGIVHVKTTSATSGSPRFVLFTAEQLKADADNIVQTMGLREDWPNLGVISLAHSYGFSNLVLPLLLHGIPLVLVGSALPEAVRRAASLLPELTLAAVPALWRTWHEAGAIPSRTRLAISAAAPLPLILEQQIYGRCGLKVHNFYGSTECGGIAYDRTAEPRRDESIAGSPMENVGLSIDESGCLVVRSNAAGESYWPERTTQLGQGIFRTSDLASIEGGTVFLRGRAGDQINIAGRKISPEAIERALSSHPEVRRCIVFGIPSDEAERGEIVVACLEVSQTVSSDALRQFLMSRLPPWQLPRDWWFVESLETNRRGKVSRAEWKQRYLDARRGAKRSAGRSM